MTWKPPGAADQGPDRVSFARSAGYPSAQTASKVARTMNRTAAMYQLTDRLHRGHTVDVSADDIVATLSVWLAELGAESPLVGDLAQALRAADWPKAHALSDYLSIDVAVTA
jgi:hypothetical protein